MAPIGTMTIKGKSGTSYVFNVYNIPVTFTANGGVYFYTKVIPNDTSHYYVYIGITENLNTRFNKHHKEDDIKKAGATHLSILWEENEEKRIAIEKDILGNVNTICNDQLN